MNQDLETATDSDRDGWTPPAQQRSWLRRMLGVFQVIRGNVLLRLMDKVGGTRFVILNSDGTEVGSISSMGLWMATLGFSSAGQFISTKFGGGSGSGFMVSSDGASYSWNVTDQGANGKRWDALAFGAALSIRLISDDDATAVNAIVLTRSGMTITSVSFAATAINLTGVLTATPPTWTTPTLVNSWVAYDGTHTTAQHSVDAFGVVRLRGMVKNGTVPSTMFTLPVGSRPVAPTYFPVLITGGAVGTLQVYANGAVQLESGTNTFVVLDGVTFPTN